MLFRIVIVNQIAAAFVVTSSLQERYIQQLMIQRHYAHIVTLASKK